VWRSKFLRGEKSPAWKDGKSLQRERLRLGTECKDWRAKVFARDLYKCQKCNLTENLQAHHIKEWAKYPDLRFDINNGLTLCIDCHGLVHGKDFTKRVVKITTCPICKGAMDSKGRSKSCRKCVGKFRKSLA
jgi:HNH endonuclease